MSHISRRNILKLFSGPESADLHEFARRLGRVSARLGKRRGYRTPGRRTPLEPIGWTVMQMKPAVFPLVFAVWFYTRLCPVRRR